MRIWRTPPPTARACHHDSVGTHGRRRRPPWRRDGVHELRGACYGCSPAVRRGGVSVGWYKHAYGPQRSLPKADVAVRLIGGLTGVLHNVYRHVRGWWTIERRRVRGGNTAGALANAHIRASSTPPAWVLAAMVEYATTKGMAGRSRDRKQPSTGARPVPNGCGRTCDLMSILFRIVLKRAIITQDDKRIVSITWYLYCLSSWGGVGARSGASPPPLSVIRFDLLRKVDHVGGAPVCSDQVRRWCDAVAAQVCADAILEVLTEDTHR